MGNKKTSVRVRIIRNSHQTFVQKSKLKFSIKNHRNKYSWLAGLGVIALVLQFIMPANVSATITPSLGTSGNFAVLASTFTANGGVTAITGDAGFTTLSGSGTHTVSGTDINPPAAQAGLDQATALASLNGEGCTFTFAPGAIDLASDTTHGPIGVYTPGVYCSSGAMDIGGGGIITLNGTGTFIFRPGGALNSSNNSSVTLTGGASACDAFWTPTAATTLGANSTFIGTTIDDAGITVGTTVSWTGQALAFGGTVTTDTDTIIKPTCGNTNPPTSLLINASKVMCDSETDLPNWGGAGVPVQAKPAMITATTASDYVAASNGKCHLEPDWSFQYGFATKDTTPGVDKLIGDHIGPADGTDSTGLCIPTNCGTRTFTGTGYSDWKNFDTSTSSNGAVAAQVNVTDLEGAPGIWVREDLQDGYVPFSYPPDGSPGSDVSAEIYCHNDIQNFDNYDEILSPVSGGAYYCVAFNAPKLTTIKTYKVVCLSETDLPNWGVDGAPGKPAEIVATTAADFVAASNGQCHLQEGWSFQYGFLTKDGAQGVNKLPGDHIGPADGTDTTGACAPGLCGPNTFTGTGYNDWKNFDTSTSSLGTVPAQVDLTDLQGAPGIWVREDLQDGYVPFSYPPDGPPGSNISAEMYCHTDRLNYDNYDVVLNPVLGGTYYCVAFNALKAGNNGGGGGTPTGSISGSVYSDANNNGTLDAGETLLTGWTVYLDTNDNGILDAGEQSTITATASPYSFTGLADGTYNVREVLQSDWTQTEPTTPFVHTVTITGGSSVTDQNFGNFSQDNGGCGTNCGGGGTSTSGGDQGGGGGFIPLTSLGSVLGANTNTNNGQGGSSELNPQVLGASTTLPRTGVPAWVDLLALLVVIVFTFNYKYLLKRI